MKDNTKSRSTVRALIWGVISTLMYVLVFTNQQTVTYYFTKGGIFAVAIITTALLFSVVHGTFANYLIEAIGFKPTGKGGH